MGDMRARSSVHRVRSPELWGLHRDNRRSGELRPDSDRWKERRIRQHRRPGRHHRTLPRRSGPVRPASRTTAGHAPTRHLLRTHHQQRCPAGPDKAHRGHAVRRCRWHTLSPGARRERGMPSPPIPLYCSDIHRVPSSSLRCTAHASGPAPSDPAGPPAVPAATVPVPAVGLTAAGRPGHHMCDPRHDLVIAARAAVPFHRTRPRNGADYVLVPVRPRFGPPVDIAQPGARPRRLRPGARVARISSWHGSKSRRAGIRCSLSHVGRCNPE